MTHCRIHILFSPDSVPWEESYNIRMYFQTGILTVPGKPERMIVIYSVCVCVCVCVCVYMSLFVCL